MQKFLPPSTYLHIPHYKQVANLPFTCFSILLLRISTTTLFSMYPKNKEEFKSMFASWPNNCISERDDPVPSGSAWGLRELETFQVLRKQPRKQYPNFLRQYIVRVEKIVGLNYDMTAACELLDRNLRNMTQYQLANEAGSFMPFLTLLAQVLDTSVISEPGRVLRSNVAEHPESQTSSTDWSSSPLRLISLQPRPSSSSPIQQRPSASAPLKQPPSSSSPIQHSSPSGRSYIPSIQSDQSSYEQ